MQDNLMSWLCNAAGSDWFYYLVILCVVFYFAFRRFGRAKGYFMVACYVGIAVLLGGIFLLCLEPGNISSSGDLIEFVKLLATGIGVVGGGIFVVCFLLWASIRQRKLEWIVDRIHDAWRSRNRRW